LALNLLCAKKFNVVAKQMDCMLTFCGDEDIASYTVVNTLKPLAFALKEIYTLPRAKHNAITYFRRLIEEYEIKPHLCEREGNQHDLILFQNALDSLLQS